MPEPKQRPLAKGIRGKRLNKQQLIQKAIDSVGATDYLEIGVEYGTTINSVNAKRKIGVDPKFQFDVEKSRRDGTILLETTSDEYFKDMAMQIDGVIYVDGLHTWKQSLSDIENSLKTMTKRSIVLVDDCLPRSAQEAFVAESHEAAGGGSWCGDVWKSIVELRINRQDLNIFTLEDHCGLAVITFGKPEKRVIEKSFKLEDIDYGFLQANAASLMNLKTQDYYLGFLAGRRNGIEA